jgi:anti-sigma regulatory factor (Ser/Thr protein kinase)
VIAQFRLKTQLPELARLAGETSRLGASHHLQEEFIAHLNLVLEEVVSNIIRHGYGGREDGEVSLAIRFAPEAIAVTVEDEGMPFNPLGLPDPDLTIPLEEREVGGLGVYLVRKFTDELDYRSEGGRNILRMVMRIAPGGLETGAAGADA